MGNLYLILEEHKYGKLTGNWRNSCLDVCYFSLLVHQIGPWKKSNRKTKWYGHHHEYFYLTLAYQCLLPHLGVGGGFVPRLIDGFLFIFVFYYEFGRKQVETRGFLPNIAVVILGLSLYVLVWELIERKEKTTTSFPRAHFTLSFPLFPGSCQKFSTITPGISASAVSQVKITADTK